MKINIKHLILGILLNILVIIACLLIYDAYRVKPNISEPIYQDTEILQDMEMLEDIEGIPN